MHMSFKRVLSTKIRVYQEIDIRIPIIHGFHMSPEDCPALCNPVFTSFLTYALLLFVECVCQLGIYDFLKADYYQCFDICIFIFQEFHMSPDKI